MAKSAVKNPRFYAGTPLSKDTVRALDSKTWKAGEFGWFDSGYVRPIASDNQNLKCVFSEDQDTATSSSDVKIERILSTASQFVGYASNGDADVAVTVANVGKSYALLVGTVNSVSIATVDVADATNTAVTVVDILANKEKYKNTTSDSPGQVIFTIKQSVLDA
jgi:hypothetical protein